MKLHNFVKNSEAHLRSGKFNDDYWFSSLFVGLTGLVFMLIFFWFPPLLITGFAIMIAPVVVYGILWAAVGVLKLVDLVFGPTKAQIKAYEDAQNAIEGELSPEVEFFDDNELEEVSVERANLDQSLVDSREVPSKPLVQILEDEDQVSEDTAIAIAIEESRREALATYAFPELVVDEEAIAQANALRNNVQSKPWVAVFPKQPAVPVVKATSKDNNASTIDVNGIKVPVGFVPELKTKLAARNANKVDVSRVQPPVRNENIPENEAKEIEQAIANSVKELLDTTELYVQEMGEEDAEAPQNQTATVPATKSVAAMPTFFKSTQPIHLAFPEVFDFDAAEKDLLNKNKASPSTVQSATFTDLIDFHAEEQLHLSTLRSSAAA